jgi:hypothetical protein
MIVNMLRIGFIAAALLLAGSSCFAQDPMPVLNSAWRPAVQKAPTVDPQFVKPARAMTVEDTLVRRDLRQLQIDKNARPRDETPDARRDIIEKNEAEANAPQPSDIQGFTYTARVRNDRDSTAKVVYWEYQFSEIARPANVVRRQFLCAVNLKKGSEMELSAFSVQGPTDVIDAASLARSAEDRFNERVQVNRIEYADGNVLQRGNWKLADFDSAVKRATATPWSKEICRPL